MQLCYVNAIVIICHTILLIGGVIKRAGLKDDASCSGEVEDSKNVGAGTSEVACNEQSETNNDENSDKRSDDDDSQSVVDSMPHSSAENEKAHSMATALDGIRLKCAKCNREQEVIFINNLSEACL